GQLDGLAGRVEHGGLADELVGGDAAGGQDRPALLGVGPVEADDDGGPQVDALERLDDAVGPLLATGDAAEDVHEDGLHALVEVDDLERGRHHVGRGAAADVQEVGGR